jgi:hypothetical protein
MINVVLKNSLLYCIFIIVFFSCKKEEKQIIVNNKIENTKKEIKQVNPKTTLPLEINFSEIGYGRIQISSNDWCDIAPDLFIPFNLR